MLTILQQPQTISPAHNDLIFLVESTNYASAGFQFIAEVKDNGTVIAKLKADLLPGEDKGVFNVQRIIAAYVSYDFDLSNTVSYFNPDGNFNYEVEFGERYLGTEYLNQTSVDKWAFHAAMTRREFASYASGEWTVANGSTAVKFLTTQRTRNIRSGQWDWLYFLDKSAPLAFFVQYVRYKSYNDSGLLKTVDATYTAGSSGPIYMGRVPSGRNTSEISTLTAGTLPVIHPNATYYTVALYDNNNNLLTEEYRVNLISECSRYDSITLWYLNPMGGFDSFLFDKVSRTVFDPVKKQMQRYNYELSGDTYEYNINKHARISFETKEVKRMTLNSDWINDQESTAIHELIASPVVFAQLDTGYIPVVVTTPSWEQKDENTDGLFNCTIDIVFDTERLQGA